MRRTGRPTRFENRLLTADGAYKSIEWAVAPEPDGSNFITVGRDVSAERERQAELETTQEALRQSQKLEAVGQLTGGLAHDFNNLLTVIRGSVELLLRPGVSEQKQRRYLAAIADTTERATKLTSQLLAFARRQTLKPEVFDAADGVRALADMIATLSGSRISVAIGTSPEPCFVNADRSQFDTALINFAVNARDAMDGVGRLSIDVRPVPQAPAIGGAPALEGDFVAVSVTDTGEGIAPETLGQIFEPFFTTKAVGAGTGLGLSQVFGFAKQSGGEVEARSRPGEGATFTLYLPRVQPADRPEHAHSGERLVEGQGACVLVVEDNAAVGAFSTQALEELGYRTVLAADAHAALAELDKDAGRFDVVFTDVVMPGMNGVELGHEIRRRFPGLPVLLASGYSHVLVQDGAHGFELLHKPYSIEELSRMLRRTVVERRSRDRPGPGPGPA
jgi:signal transduction histidine kinase/CheY-like chemotaxis protein